jgi:hypothetical protein
VTLAASTPRRPGARWFKTRFDRGYQLPLSEELDELPLSEELLEELSV